MILPNPKYSDDIPRKCLLQGKYGLKRPLRLIKETIQKMDRKLNLRTKQSSSFNNKTEREEKLTVARVAKLEIINITTNLKQSKAKLGQKKPFNTNKLSDSPEQNRKNNFQGPKSSKH